MVLGPRRDLECRFYAVNNGTEMLARRSIKSAPFLRCLQTKADLTPIFASKASFTVSKWACRMQLPPKSKYERIERERESLYVCMCSGVYSWWCAGSGSALNLAPNGYGCITIWRWFLSALHARALFRPEKAFETNSEWTTLLGRRALITPPRRRVQNILRCFSAPRALITWASETQGHDQITISCMIRLIQNQYTTFVTRRIWICGCSAHAGAQGNSFTILRWKISIALFAVLCFSECLKKPKFPLLQGKHGLDDSSVSPQTAKQAEQKISVISLFRCSLNLSIFAKVV